MFAHGKGGAMNSNSTKGAKRSFRFRISSIALAGLVLAAAAGAAEGQGKRVDLNGCPNLVAPAGNKVFFSVYAVGVQIYRWDGTAWIFVAPEAVLFPNRNASGVVGHHYA